MQRSTRKELLDNDDIPFDDIRQNMKELDFINTWLGGHAITISGLKKILATPKKNGQPISICETGCGGGDNLRSIDRWCTKNNIAVRMTGIDKKKECIELAKNNFPGEKYEWIFSDYHLVKFSDQKPDIIFSSLFCHHFNADALEEMMLWMRLNSKMGFFINDLHRHFLAYYSIKALTSLFSKSYLVKNDAPLSVQRGFIKKDWVSMMQRAGIQHYSIEWKWAFRWLVTVKS
ncbi:MAG TPA: methyltransferase domain-containing protein [Agriterribacter sp.]|nr:methyltransferase domain-containing protein [Agriterribacter sp.]